MVTTALGNDQSDVLTEAGDVTAEPAGILWHIAQRSEALANRRSVVR